MSKKKKRFQIRFFGQRQNDKTGENALWLCTESSEQQRDRTLLQNPALWNNRKEKVVVGFVYNELPRKKINLRCSNSGFKELKK